MMTRALTLRRSTYDLDQTGRTPAMQRQSATLMLDNERTHIMRYEGVLKRLLVVAVVLGFAACGQDSGPLALTGEGTTPSPAIVTINGVQLLKAPDGRLALSGKQSDKADIGASGGMLRVDGADLVVPPGALQQTTRLSMKTGSPQDAGLWSYEFGPSGTTFKKSATLTVEVSVAELQAMGIDPDRLSIAYVTSPDHNDWQIIGVDYDWDSETISAPVWHFSRYALCIE